MMRKLILIFLGVSMAKVTYHYSCGCGFKTDKESEALKHASEKKHTLDVKGQVTP
jgi:hypothetical protein